MFYQETFRPGIHVNATRNAPPTQKPLQTKFNLSWQWHSLIAVAPHQDNPPCHTAKTVQDWPEEHDKELMVSILASKFPKSHDDLWDTPEHVQSMEAHRTQRIHYQCPGARHYRTPPTIQYILWMLDCIGILGIWRPGWHLELFAMFLGSFLSSFLNVAGRIIPGPLRSEIVIAMRGCTWSATFFAWVVRVRWHLGKLEPGVDLFSLA